MLAYIYNILDMLSLHSYLAFSGNTIQIDGWMDGSREEYSSSYFSRNSQLATYTHTQYNKKGNKYINVILLY